VSDFSPSPTRYQALIQLLRTAEDLWNASRVFFARWDLSPSQFNVLNVLFSEPNGLSQSELSRLLIMHRSNATGLVDRLEKRGLLRRQDAPEDRRAYRVVLTSQGQDLLNAIYPHYYRAADAVWATLPETRASALLVELQELAQNAVRVAGGSEGPHTDTKTEPSSPPPHPFLSSPVDPPIAASIEAGAPLQSAGRSARQRRPRARIPVEAMPMESEPLRTSDL
jgi:MarR family 2-MHQ and catechol resistance regulon transcriptional repressor